MKTAHNFVRETLEEICDSRFVPQPHPTTSVPSLTPIHTHTHTHAGVEQRKKFEEQIGILDNEHGAVSNLVFHPFLTVLYATDESDTIKFFFFHMCVTVCFLTTSQVCGIGWKALV